jgi:hypothetical protein
MLMYQLLAGRNAVSERYYRALYAVLLTEGATGAAGERAAWGAEVHKVLLRTAWAFPEQ